MQTANTDTHTYNHTQIYIGKKGKQTFFDATQGSHQNIIAPHDNVQTSCFHDFFMRKLIEHSSFINLNQAASF